MRGKDLEHEGGERGEWREGNSTQRRRGVKVLNKIFNKYRLQGKLTQVLAGFPRLHAQAVLRPVRSRLPSHHVIMPPMRRQRPRFRPVYLLVVPVVCLVAFLVYNIPFVHEKLSWRLDELRTRIFYAINPPQEVVFVPQEAATTPQASSTPEPSATPQLTPTATPTLAGPTRTFTPVPTDTPTPTPLPQSVRLKGIRHEYQKWNNCGPANLSMALSFWDWQGDQLDVAGVVKPNSRDKNVMPYEMETFVEQQPGLQALVRPGGDVDMVKRLLAAGFPVLIEKGFEGDSFDGWMGHYEVISGYDDAQQKFWVYDSYVGPDYDFTIDYETVLRNWRAFNYTYLVIYPTERETEVLSLLGAQADETYNFQYAAQLASDEIYALTGRDQYFAWYNRGSSLVKLQDFAGAAEAYDQAFLLYAEIPEDLRPWRMLWYQTGPYFAYYYAGRYYDVIALATSTIGQTEEPAFEETWYWRGMAKLALGDSAGAIEDFQTSLKWHPAFEPSVYQLSLLGIEP